MASIVSECEEGTGEGAPAWTASLCGWIDANLGLFLPASREGFERAPFDRYKAVGELAMALYAIAHLGPAYRNTVAPLIKRAGQMLDDEASAIDWDLWRAAGAGSRFHAISLTAFVLLAELNGQPLSPQIADAVAVAGDARIMDLYVLRTVMGLPADPEPLVSRMAQIAAQLACGAAVSAPALYDLTHTALYLSVLGRRTLSVPYKVDTILRAHLPELMRARLRLYDYDLTAELLLTEIFLSGAPSASSAGIVRALISAIAEDGSVAGPAWMHTCGHSDFEATYHTTLVVLMALCFAVPSPTPPRRDGTFG